MPIENVATVAGLAFLLVVALMTVRVCNQYQRAVIFFLGRYSRTSGPGIYFMVPFLEWNALVDVRTTTTAVEQQETITKDNVPVKINAVIWRRVLEPRNSLIEVANVEDAVTQAAVTALRATIGQHTLDDVLKDQESVSGQLQRKLVALTEPWGVKVEQVQMKNIEIPPTMQRAMAQEAEALREKRSRQI
jgi:regulator of protease activity HflC (stomatin/prohibitin superfamily)